MWHRYYRCEGATSEPFGLCQLWSELFWPIDMIRYKLSGKPLATTLNYTNSRYCPIVSGCCLFVRMSFIKQIGFFDENVFLYCEEPILAHQVKTAGMKLYYMAEAQAVHRHIKFQKGILMAGWYYYVTAGIIRISIIAILTDYKSHCFLSVADYVNGL